MKKTLILFACVSGVAFAAVPATVNTVTVHGITFTNQWNPGAAFQNQYPATNSYLIETGVSGFGNFTDSQGMYFQEGSSFRFNTGGDKVVIDYLYIGGTMGLNFGNITPQAGQITWNNEAGAFRISNLTTGTQEWVDINADYGTNIILTDMDGGSLYLNDFGTLNSVLGNTNTIYANALTTGIENSSLYTMNADGSITRKLMSGNYSNWDGTINLGDVTDFTVTHDSTGLSVTYNLPGSQVPEPATATLSLLALAGLAARRRRK